MMLRTRIVRLEDRHRDQLRVTATLFTFTDQTGQERRRVIVTQTGAVLDLDAYRLAYPDGELCEFQFAGIDPDWL